MIIESISKMASIVFIMTYYCLAGTFPNDSSIVAAICPAEFHCVLKEKTNVGKNDQGNSVYYIGAIETRDKNSDNNEPLGEWYALVHIKENKIVLTEPIVEFSGNYGASGNGESIELNGDEIVHTIDQGSCWHGTTTTTWSIFPKLRIIGENSRAFHTLAPIYFNSIKDNRGVVKVEWYVPYCKKGSDSTDEEEPEMDEEEPDPYFYTEIPQLNENNEFIKKWDNAIFPKEAIEINSSENSDGYIVYGEAGKAEDALFKIIKITNNSFALEIIDDKIITGNKNWIKEDHIEIWAGGKLADFYQFCVKRYNSKNKIKDTNYFIQDKAYQWGVRLTDGAVFKGIGKPTIDPIVKYSHQLNSGKIKLTRILIEFLKEPKSISFIYSDTDDGKKQKRLIGTSKVDLKRPLSLGQ